jgi:Ser/Thr protein kinase RdoA (MazF antagonist)
MSFDHVTPDFILSSVEAATGVRLSSVLLALPSYINRVYEVRAIDGTKLIAKFYRPGRWSREAILDEHIFVHDCLEAEIPVVAPNELLRGTTVEEHGGILLSVFPKKAGRQLEINDENDWLRLGSLVGRMHLCGEKKSAGHRVTINPRMSTQSDDDHILKNVVPERFREQFKNVAMRLIEISVPLFEGTERIRIHGDCHRGNILNRLEEGLLLIDFDDMAMGPPVQDLWLLLPDRAEKSKREIDLFLQGYERFRRFDRGSLRCIEPLRAMRMVYFLGWCSRQMNDAQFKKHFPDWGSDQFWQKEINDLREQLGFVEEISESAF